MQATTYNSMEEEAVPFDQKGVEVLLRGAEARVFHLKSGQRITMRDTFGQEVQFKVIAVRPNGKITIKELG